MVEVDKDDRYAWPWNQLIDQSISQSINARRVGAVFSYAGCPSTRLDLKMKVSHRSLAIIIRRFSLIK